MPNGTVDGLGYEEVGQLGSQVASLFLTGSIDAGAQISGLNVFATGSVQTGRLFAASTISGAGLVNAANVVVAGSVDADVVYNNAGSPYYNGLVLQFTSETVITGGMWVTVSGAAGTAAPLARAAAASTTPLGIATATAGSNATVNVLVAGLAYLVADTTVANATQIRMGAGGALNTVAQATVGTGARGVALAGAGSEGVALVYLW